MRPGARAYPSALLLRIFNYLYNSVSDDKSAFFSNQTLEFSEPIEILNS